MRRFIGSGLLVLFGVVPGARALDDAPLIAAAFPAPQVASDIPELLDSTLADLDGDGLVDLISVGTDDAELGRVAVRLGRPGGGFGPVVDYAAGVSTRAVVAGDLDGDGRLDVIASNAGSDSVTVWYGASDGRLARRRDFPAGPMPRQLVLADLDASGSLDVAVSNTWSRRVTVLLGDGTGALGAPVGVRAGYIPKELAAADVNLDGALDLVVLCDGDNALVTLLGRGNGSFHTVTPFTHAKGGGPSHFALTDFDRDGLPDLVVGYRTSDVLNSFLGAGNGRFTLAASLPLDTSAGDLALGDLDGDAELDLAVIADSDDELRIFRGAGGGVFEPHAAYPLERNSSGVLLHDLDGDGLDDALVRGFGESDVPAESGKHTLLRNRGGAQFASAAVLGADDATRIRFVGLADVTGDGHRDALGIYLAEDDLRVWPGDGAGGFGDALLVPSGYFLHRSVQGVDMDLDGLRDLVLTSDDPPGRVTVIPALGAGQFSAPLSTVGGFDFAPTTAVIADFDGDGLPDVAVDAAPLESVALLFNLGGGVLAAPVMLPVGLRADGLVADDLDGDGVLDLLATSSLDDGAAVLRGLGGAAFAPGPALVLPEHPVSPSLGDLNGDGVPDLVVALRGVWILPPSQIGVALGLGDGGFGPLTTLDLESEAHATRLADVDLDGQLDLLVTLGTHDLALWRGTGDGGFHPPTTHLGSQEVHDLAVGDIDGDGAPDLLLGNEAPEGAWVLRNQHRP